VLYEAHPANLDCSVTYFDYSVSQLAPNQTAVGTLWLKLRCQHVPAGARVSLKLRDPIVLRVPIRNSTGRVAFSLDKPPGSGLPLVSLRTYRIGGPCRLHDTRLRISRLRLEASSSVTCGRLTRQSTAVLTIGGLLRSRSTQGTSLTGRSAATPRARATAAAAEQITCTGQGAVTATCKQSLNMWRARTVFKDYNFDGCPKGYHYTPVGWPGWEYSAYPSFENTSDGDFLGWWTFSNWGGEKTLNLSWRCDLSKPSVVTGPEVLGGPMIVGRSVSCTNGTWNGYPNRFDDYEWVREPSGDVVAVGQQYTVASDDYHHTLQCGVRAHNAVGSSFAESPPTIEVVKGPPQSIAKPTMLKWSGFSYSIPVPGPGPGTVQGEDWLRCTSNASSWIDAHSITFQWLQDGYPIPGATGDQYHVADTQAGRQVSCQATASNQAGSTSAVSASSGPIQKGGGGLA
jgi:hypothetical protein